MNQSAGAQPSPLAPEEFEQRTSLTYLGLKLFLAVATAPYRRAFKLYTWQPLKEIRSADGDRGLLISLVKDWKTDKYTELQSVQVAATFCGGAAFSALPWVRATNAIWVADALWFTSLICAISAIITSIQTKSILDDLPARDQLNASLSELEVQRMRRKILRYKRTPGTKHWIMIFIWQQVYIFPSMTMAYAWCTFIGGLTVYICNPFIQGMPWQDRHKVAIVYLAVGSVALIAYLVCTIFVYMGEKDFEKSVASTRSTTQTTTRVNTDVLETGNPQSTVGGATGTQTTRTTSSVAENDLVKLSRSKVLMSPDPREKVDQRTDGSAVFKRQLL